MSNMLDWARYYASMGISVFPCAISIENGKKRHRPIADWDSASTTDGKTHERWFGPGGAWNGPNVALCIDTGKSGLVVVDPDEGLDADGSQKGGLARWLALFPPATYRVRTPGGGEHWYYRGLPELPIGISQNKIAKHVDVRGLGGYVVAPPSADVRGPYLQLGTLTSIAALPPVPQCVIEAHSRRQEERAPAVPVDLSPAGRERAARYCAAGIAREVERYGGLTDGRASGAFAFAVRLVELANAASFTLEDVETHYWHGIESALGNGVSALTIKDARRQWWNAVTHVGERPAIIPDDVEPEIMQLPWLASSRTSSEPPKLSALKPIRGARAIAPPSAPADVAMELSKTDVLHVDGIPCLAHWRGDFYQWTSTRWEVVDHDAVTTFLYQALHEAEHIDPMDHERVRPWEPSRRRVEDVMHALGSLALPRANALEPDDAAARIVPLWNGILTPATRALTPLTPKIFNLHCLPFEYDPHAEAPSWLAFLSDVFGDDTESISLLQEWFGYVLSGDTSHQKVLNIVGPPGCGKGTIMRTMVLMTGRHAVCSPTIASLSDRFGEEQFIGKTLATMPDVRWNVRGVPEAIAAMLAISGEDNRTIQRKNRSPWTGELTVRVMLSGNDLPQFADASSAMGRRFLNILIERSAVGREDLKLGDRIQQELPGILNWALDGWDRLTANGRFTVSSVAAGMAEEISELSSPIAGFAKDWCQFSPDVATRTSELYQAWRLYREASGVQASPHIGQFARDLASYGRAHGVRLERRSFDGKQARCVVGVRLDDSISSMISSRIGHHVQ